MEILLISHAYPPFPASGSRRGESLANAFVRNGHRVTALTARLPGEAGRWRTHEANLRVVPVGGMITPRHLYLSLRRGRVKKRGARSGYGERPRAAPSFRDRGTEESSPTWKRHLLSLLLLPDREQGFILPAVLRGLREARSGSDILYTTGPPISTHVAGLLIKRATGVPWVAEFRDPWVVDAVPLKPPQLRSPLGDRIHRWLYRQCLGAADRLVAVTAATANVLASELPGGVPDRVILARNGIPEMAPPEEDHVVVPGPFRIVHLGDFYGPRSPEAFLETVAEIQSGAGGGGLPPLHIEMVGHSDDARAEAYRRLTARLGIAGVVRFRDWVPFEEGQQLLAGADLLLLIAQGQPLQVPNKLYEYLGHRKPILAFADRDGETAAMLRAAGGHYLITEDHDRRQAARTVRAAIRGEEHGRLPGETDDVESLLAAWSTRAQLGHLLARLESLGLTRTASS
ncbi:MAG: glycosyltransferase [Gemmatimonadota bacterium]